MMTVMHRPQGRMLRAFGRRIGWLSVLSLGLAACAASDTTRHPGSGWSAGGSSKEVEVERARYRHVVHFATDDARIEAGERDRLLAFLAAVELTPQDQVRLEGHADERASDLYNIELASRRAQSVKDFLRDQGVRGVDIDSAAFGEQAPARPGSGPEAWRHNRRVEVVVERHVVVLPPCPDWSRRSGTDFANLPHSNFGCATQTNFGLMIAEPRDLMRGRTLAPADGTREAEAIVRYRTGEIIDLEEQELE